MTKATIKLKTDKEITKLFNQILNLIEEWTPQTQNDAMQKFETWLEKYSDVWCYECLEGEDLELLAGMKLAELSISRGYPIYKCGDWGTWRAYFVQDRETLKAMLKQYLASVDKPKLEQRKSELNKKISELRNELKLLEKSAND
jgi:thiaminase